MDTSRVSKVIQLNGWMDTVSQIDRQKSIGQQLPLDAPPALVGQPARQLASCTFCKLSSVGSIGPQATQLRLRPGDSTRFQMVLLDWIIRFGLDWIGFLFSLVQVWSFHFNSVWFSLVQFSSSSRSLEAKLCAYANTTTTTTTVYISIYLSIWIDRQSWLASWLAGVQHIASQTFNQPKPNQTKPSGRRRRKLDGKLTVNSQVSISRIASQPASQLAMCERGKSVCCCQPDRSTCLVVVEVGRQIVGTR